MRVICLGWNKSSRISISLENSLIVEKKRKKKNSSNYLHNNNNYSNSSGHDRIIISCLPHSLYNRKRKVGHLFHREQPHNKYTEAKAPSFSSSSGTQLDSFLNSQFNVDAAAASTDTPLGIMVSIYVKGIEEGSTNNME